MTTVDEGVAVVDETPGTPVDTTHDHQVPIEERPENAPDLQDVIEAVLEELRQRDGQITQSNDQRMFFKAQSRKALRKCEVLQATVTSLQAANDQLRAENDQLRTSDDLGS